ncbi:MAG: histidine phosphatase family protein [Ignavibacteriae bacterium]|nr:histidine phosphatase family protein [Ignavibacteriota bacterium]
MLFRLVTFFVCITSFAVSQPKLYIVRHAEKLANWPEETLGTYHPLSEKGVATADRLAKHFETMQFAAIYSSPTTRTLHTAFPLAQKLNMDINTAKALADTSAINAFLAELLTTFKPDQSVLLVSHSNIIPYVLMKAGMPRSCFEEMGIIRSMGSSWLVTEGYDNIYVVEQQETAKEHCGGVTRTKF